MRMSTNGKWREIDYALTAQLVVGWAGESGEQKRLGWWRSDLVSPYGGMDLFKSLLPSTWEWAVLQGARETARRREALVHDSKLTVNGPNPVLSKNWNHRLNRLILKLCPSGRCLELKRVT